MTLSMGMTLVEFPVFFGEIPDKFLKRHFYVSMNQSFQLFYIGFAIREQLVDVLMD